MMVYCILQNIVNIS